MKINTFYKDGTEIVRPDLFDKTALGIAEDFVVTFTNKFGKPDGYGVGRTQLRRIYDEVKRFEHRLNIGTDAWEKNHAYIKMIKSKITYNTVRAMQSDSKKEGVYKKLSEFITEGIDLSKNENDFRVFAALFEAVYGFYYEKSKDFDKGN